MGDDQTLPKNIFVDKLAEEPGEAAGQDKPDEVTKKDTGSAGGGSGALKDKNLTCRDCNQEFVWTGGEQDFYKQKGFDNPPTRCRICRGKYKAAREQFGRVESKITCKKCGKESTVPFVPRDPNTVLCRECFQSEKK